MINLAGLNAEEKGIFLGSFEAEDKILVIYNDGNYEITDQEMTQRFDAENILLIEKFDPEKIITAVYLDKKNCNTMSSDLKLKQQRLNNKFFFIKEGEGNYLEAVTTDAEPILAVQSGRGAQIRKAKFKIAKSGGSDGMENSWNKIARL